MNLDDAKPLKPLDGGVILLVGVKASNFDDDIKDNPRVVMWDSQQQHWTNKDFPANTRAVFLTRFVGHAIFEKIISEARKKNITIFNPSGTGLIRKQVLELLDIKTEAAPVVNPQPEKEPMVNRKRRLAVLVPLIDYSQKNIVNAHRLFAKANELGVSTTLKSMIKFVATERHRMNGTYKPRSSRQSAQLAAASAPKSVVVEILDDIVKELQDMRDFIIATERENKELKLRIEKFKKVLND